MTGPAQVAFSKGGKAKSFSPTAGKKKLQTRATSEPQLLPAEAQELKDILRATASPQPTRFSFSRLRRVVVPPVQIPPELAASNAINNIVGGNKIPMTKAMWRRHRARMLHRLPGRIDERVAW